jgi:hypothetical protein
VGMVPASVCACALYGACAFAFACAFAGSVGGAEGARGGGAGAVPNESCGVWGGVL